MATLSPGFTFPGKAVTPPAPVEVIAPRQSKSFPLALLLLAIALGALCKFCGPLWAQTIFHAVQLDRATALTALLAALFGTIVVHEAGHLVAALLVNFELVSVCIGPLRATRSYRSWKVQPSGRLFTGSVSAIPRHLNRWRPRVLLVVAAGPLTTLLTGMAAAFLLLHHPTAAGWTKTFLGAFAQLSCFLFLLGFIPNSRFASIRNDARLFLLLSKDTPEAEEILLYHAVTRLEIDGVRPRDYPLPLIHAMANTRSRPEVMLVYAHAIASWALDRSDLANADAWDQRALELSSKSNEAAQQVTFAKSACLDIVIRDDRHAAAGKLAQLEVDSLLPEWLMHRTRAIHFFCQGDIPQSLAEIARAQHAFPANLPYFDFEHELLAALHRKALAFQPPGVSPRSHNRVA